MGIKEKLEKIIEYKEISNKTLANMIGTNPSQVTRWLSGETEPRNIFRIRIEKIFKEIS